MRWQRVARRVVAIIGLATAVAVYALSRSRPPSDRPEVSTERDPAASVAAGHGVQVRYRGSDRQFTIEYDAIRQYPDGRQVWDHPRLTLEDGTHVSASTVETQGKSASGDLPAEMTLKGGVKFHTDDGADIETEEAVYTPSTGRASLPGGVQFVRGRMSGSGTGATYDRDSGTFHLLADAKVTMADPEGGVPLHAAAASMTFDRTSRTLAFDGQAEIVHATDVMTADQATLALADNNEQFKAIGLQGHAKVTPDLTGSTGTPDMRAEQIDLTFHDGTQIIERATLHGQSAIVMPGSGGRREISAADIVADMAADGKTMTHLAASPGVTVHLPAGAETPERTITAAALVASGDDQHGLTSAHFTGGVTFVEMVKASGGQRYGRSRTLTMTLEGQLDAIDEARFQQDVVFKDANVSGVADIGLYGASKGTLVLTPEGDTPSRTAHATDGRVTVDASDSIEVDLATQNLHARRDVKTVTAAASDASSRDAALLSGDKPVYGFGAEFWYDSTSGQARYRGATGTPARVQQGDDVRVAALDMTLVDATSDLNAQGDVDATLTLAEEGGSPTARPQPYRFQSNTLRYADANRTADFEGSPVTMTSTDGVTTAHRILLTLARESRTLERFDATTDVQATLAEGRRALSDTLIYEAGPERYTLRGSPVVLRAPGDQPGTCSQWKGRVGYFTVNERAPEFPAAENPGAVEARDVPCASAMSR